MYRKRHQCCFSKSGTTLLKLTVSHCPQVFHEEVGHYGDENGKNGAQKATVSGQQLGYINKWAQASKHYKNGDQAEIVMGNAKEEDRLN